MAFFSVVVYAENKLNISGDDLSTRDKKVTIFFPKKTGGVGRRKSGELKKGDKQPIVSRRMFLPEIIATR